MKSKQIVLLGLPGAEVESRAIALSQRWHVPYVSTRLLLEKAISDASDLGTKASAFIEKGEAIPDELMLRLLRRRVEQPDMMQGFVLTGFPRSASQAEAFDELMTSFELPVVDVAYIKALMGLLINRLVAQEGAGTGVSIVRDRLKRCQEEIDPVIEYYQQQSRVITINGSLSEAEVANALFQLGQEETGAARFVRDEAELDALLTKESALVVDCIASWCGPCKQVSPLIDRLAEEMGDRAKVVKLDFDNNRQVAKRFGLKGMPSVMFFKDGALLETLRGVKSYQIYSKSVEKLIAANE